MSLAFTDANADVTTFGIQFNGENKYYSYDVSGVASGNLAFNLTVQDTIGNVSPGVYQVSVFLIDRLGNVSNYLTGTLTVQGSSTSGSSIEGKWAVSWTYLSGFAGSPVPSGAFATWTFDQSGNWIAWDGTKPGSDVMVSGRLVVSGNNVSGRLNCTYTSMFGPEPSTLDHSGSFQSSNRIEGTVIYHRSNPSGFNETTTYTFVMTK
jgi:hypothetical protein